jgi:methylated-DNA-[protein]-cysteine S-methyltransferase
MSKSKAHSYAAWATAWGPMGACAGDAGLTRVVLPHYQMNDLLELLAWETPGAKRDEKPFQRLIELSRDYFNARPTDFGEIACEMPAGTLAALVLRACREIPWGATMSYHMLAEKIGQPDAARAVATALSKNAIPLVIPCHRVTYADGRCGGFSAAGGPALKERMLAMEKPRR